LIVPFSGPFGRLPVSTGCPAVLRQTSRESPALGVPFGTALSNGTFPEGTLEVLTLLALTSPAFSQRRGFLTAMRNRTLGELQVELFNLLRTTPQYQRLIRVDVEPSDAFPCGWRAEIVGDFTVDEHNAANDLVRELQRCYALVDNPLLVPQRLPAKQCGT
jgi:hypothetical protein